MSLDGGALGWVLFTAAQGRGGVGFVPVSVDSVLFDYCEGPGQWRTQRFQVLYSKFEFAVQDTQDAIKTSKPKSRKNQEGFGMNIH